MRDTDQCSHEKIRGLAIQTGDRDQPAEIDQMMDPQALFFAVFAHLFVTASAFHHVTTGRSTPRKFAAGTAPK